MRATNLLTTICLTVMLAGAAFAPAVSAAEVLLYADNFDSGTSAANWQTFSHAGDFTADFAYDYSARGIAPAPNSTGGTTIGIRLGVNNTDGIQGVDAVSAYPIGVTFADDQILRFDMWINYNGGAGGGSGSTEYATAGILHSGTRVVWNNNASSDGHWFGVTGEGGASDDYVAYAGGTLLSADAATFSSQTRNSTDVFYQTFFTAPPFETQGAPGKQWVQVEISYIAGVLEWRMNGRLMAVRNVTSPTVGTIMLGTADTFSSVANPGEDNFVLYDNVRVVAPDCNANDLADAAEIAAGSALDCNCNSVPDDCEALSGGDYDNDGDADLVDFRALAECLNGPTAPPLSSPTHCVDACLEAFDANTDDQLDLDDFAAFQRGLTIDTIPPRPAGAPTGTQFVGEVAGFDRTTRENRILEEITSGNVPGFLRTFVPVQVSATIGGVPTTATFYVTNDYLAIGVDRDFVRMPMSPLIAQPIADAFDCLLPTRKMVNAIYTAATVKLAPSPISPTTTDIMRMTTMYRHHQTVEGQRAGQPLGALIGGIKKDVVITPLLASNPGKVAIYGWHQLNGSPIQPLYLGHVDFYADYSHGIRLVRSRMLVNGVEMNTADVLADPNLNVLLSDEGVVTNPSY